VVFYFVDQVSGVALIAGNAMAGMLGVFEEFLRLAGDVAGKTARSVFGGGSFKSEKREIVQRLGGGGVITVRRLDGVRVSFRWAMAAFAPVNVVLAREDELGVTRFTVLGGFFFVAGGASFWPGEVTGRSSEFGRDTGH